MDASLLSTTKKADYFAILDDVNYDLKNYSEIESIYSEVNERYHVNISPILISELEEKIHLLSN